MRKRAYLSQQELSILYVVNILYISVKALFKEGSVSTQSTYAITMFFHKKLVMKSSFIDEKIRLDRMLKYTRKIVSYV